MKKQVLSFGEFILESQISLQEAKGGEGITEETLIKILDSQKKIALDKSKGKKEGLAEYLKFAIESRDNYDSLPEEDKKKLLEEVLKKAKTDGIDSKWIDEKLEDYEKEKKVPFNPRIWVLKKETVLTTPPEEKTKPGDEKPFVNIDLIPEEDKESIFKNNMWGYDESKLNEVFSDPEKIKKIAEGISLLVKRDIEESGKAIKSVMVSSSCSRYRNTGSAEGLSWAELSYKRSKTFTDLFLASAQEAGDEYMKSLQDRIKIDFLGTNKDGTSGPDPIGDVKKGYYANEGGKSVWKSKSGTDPLKIMVNKIEVKSEGPVLGKEATLENALGLDSNPIKSVPSSSDDYDQFRFIEIKIDVLPIEYTDKKRETQEPRSTPGEKIVTTKYQLLVRLSKGKEESKGKARLLPPAIRNLFRKSKSKKFKYNPFNCPSFK